MNKIGYVFYLLLIYNVICNNTRKNIQDGNGTHHYHDVHSCA
jgi:hypothetical protein